MRLHWLILLSVILGVFTGITFPSAALYIAWIGDLFINALTMLMVPVIFFSIVTSIGELSSTGHRFKRLWHKTAGMYLVTMLLAILTGWILVNTITPGSHIHLQISQDIPAGVGQTSILEIVTGFIPKNILYAFTQNNTIPVILVAFLISAALPAASPEEKATLTSFFKGGLEVTMRITQFVICISPIGIFAVLVKQFSMSGDFLALLKTMSLYVLTVTVGLGIHTFIWLPLMLRYGYRINPWKHFRNMSAPLLTAFSTSSSAAALPLSLHAVHTKDGVSADITNFTIPLGAAINMNGAALLECVAVIFIAQAYGIELSFIQQLLVIFTSLLCAIGSAGIPMSALFMMAIILSVVGLPVEGIGLVIGVDRILDMMRTAVNVYGDTCVAVMVARSEGEKLPVDINISGK